MPWLEHAGRQIDSLGRPRERRHALEEEARADAALEDVGARAVALDELDLEVVDERVVALGPIRAALRVVSSGELVVVGARGFEGVRAGGHAGAPSFSTLSPAAASEVGIAPTRLAASGAGRRASSRRAVQEQIDHQGRVVRRVGLAARQRRQNEGAHRGREEAGERVGVDGLELSCPDARLDEVAVDGTELFRLVDRTGFEARPR